MTREVYDGLASELPEMLAKVSACPDHLQEAVLNGMIAAFIAPPHGAVLTEQTVETPMQVGASNGNAPNEPSYSWDYRRELIELAEHNNLDLNSLHDYEYGVYVAYVRTLRCPDSFDDHGITTKLVQEAWRGVRTKLPTRARRPLNKAVEMGLLDQGKKKGHYVLTPIGENRINDLLSHNKAT